MAQWNGFGVGVDLGTSNTVAIGRWSDGRTRPLMFDGQPLLMSAVYLDAHGNLLTGRDADRMAQADPARYEPNPKRRIDEGAVFLGDREVTVVEMLRALLTRVALTAQETFGFVPAVALTYPASWGPTRRQILTEAATGAGFPSVRLVPEPIAAARYFTEVVRHPVPAGGTLAVFDFGGGTLDVALVRAAPGGHMIIGAGGADDLGGLDIDEALVAHLGVLLAREHPQVWRQIAAPADDLERRHRKAFWNDIRAAKEMLSRAASAPVPIPGVSSSLHLTRAELEQLATPLVRRAAGELRKLLVSAGVRPADLSGIFLVGGSSRVPLVASLLHAELGIAPTVLEQPELPVAEGALADLATAAELAADAGAGSGSIQAGNTSAALPVSAPPRTPPTPYTTLQTAYPVSAPPPGYGGPATRPAPVIPQQYQPQPSAFRQPPPGPPPPPRRKGHPFLVTVLVLGFIAAACGGGLYVTTRPRATFTAEPAQSGTVAFDGADGRFMRVLPGLQMVFLAQVGRGVAVAYTSDSGTVYQRARLGDAANWEVARLSSDGFLLLVSAPEGGKRQLIGYSKEMDKSWTLTVNAGDDVRLDPTLRTDLVWLDTAKQQVVNIDRETGVADQATAKKVPPGSRILNLPGQSLDTLIIYTLQHQALNYGFGQLRPVPTQNPVLDSNTAAVIGNTLYVGGDGSVSTEKVKHTTAGRKVRWIGPCGEEVCVVDDGAGGPQLYLYRDEREVYRINVPDIDLVGGKPFSPAAFSQNDPELVVPTLKGKEAGALVFRLADGKALGSYTGVPVLIAPAALLLFPGLSADLSPDVKLTGIDLKDKLRTTVSVGAVRTSSCAALSRKLVCARDKDFGIWQIR